jgi:hypothetical protein
MAVPRSRVTITPGRLPLAFQQFPHLASGLTTDALRGQVPGAFSLGSFELVESPSNCPSVDAELVGNVCLALTSKNAPAYLLDVPIRKFGCRSHPKSLLRWDISRDITRGSRKSRKMNRNPCEQAKEINT